MKYRMEVINIDENFKEMQKCTFMRMYDGIGDIIYSFGGRR